MDNLLEHQSRLVDAEEALRKASDLADNNLYQIAEPVQRQIWQEEVASTYRSLVDLEIRKSDPQKALAIWEWYFAAPIRQKSAVLKRFYPFSLHYPYSELNPTSPQHVSLSYVMLPHQLVIWVASSKGLTYRRIEIEEQQLSREVSLFTKLCSDPRSHIPLLKIRAQRLYNVLIAPVADFTTQDTILTVEPDDHLRNLPFQALVTTTGHYLVEQCPVVYTYGRLFRFVMHRSEILQKWSPSVVIGSTAVMPGQLPIPYVKQEAAMVASFYSNSITLIGEKASVDSFMSAIRNAALVHFAGHAAFDFDTTGLVLRASDSDPRPVLWWDEAFVHTSFRHASLVVLSACSTGRYGLARDSGHEGLVYPLLQAGVPHIVASRWDVNSKDTYTLMSLFYTRLSDGTDVESALAYSARSLIKSADTSHPEAWAGVFAIQSAVY